MKRLISFCISCLLLLPAMQGQNYLLIPMDNSQADHLKAYGLSFWVLQQDVDVQWLLNYRGGSFMFARSPIFEAELQVRGITYEVVAPGKSSQILATVTSEDVNMDAVLLEKAPKIAVYSPPYSQPWDDAVTLALKYAEIPYDVIYDVEVLQGKLTEYDWLHLHHEDFTGQFGKYHPSNANASWVRTEVVQQEAMAHQFGYTKVSQLKLEVAKEIKRYLENGGFLFAMCSATDTYDIALSAEGLDVVHAEYDHDGMTPNMNEKLDFSKTLAFQDYILLPQPGTYEFSTIDANYRRSVPMNLDYFTLFEFSAKWDPVPTMLCQNHTRTVKGFLGQTTSFRRETIKPGVLIMGELKAYNEVRYIHGNYGRGMWTFYGGHDPEDYRHVLGEDPTDLTLHPNSPGYRLILNNILFPAARKKMRKT
ncbi:MAG: asparagine synthetase B [Bacteroidia bacterium]|nr:asparagine synthetase B [Bacteroidia bacterium]